MPDDSTNPPPLGPQEYDLKPDPVEEIPKLPAEPKLRPLQYSSRRYDTGWRRGPGRATEFTVGFVSYFGVIAATLVLARGGPGFYFSSSLLLLLPLGVLMGLAIYLHGAKGWRSFVPGVLAGLGLSCLIGAGGVIWIVATCRGM
jgi:hypothetical protein